MAGKRTPSVNPHNTAARRTGFAKGLIGDTDGKTVFYLIDSSTKIAGQKKDQIVAALHSL
jgi:hypothetical protein